MKTPYFFILSIILFMGCNHTNQQYRPESHPSPEPQPLPSHVQRVDTAGLMILYPDFTSIDLVCDTLPSKSDEGVILFAEAAYTGELLDGFKHLNIAGDHVSSGKRYKGYHCSRNTGAFVYSAGKWQFCGAGYSAAMDQAAQHGGCAFAQELMIHDGTILPTGRADGDKNQFRALCNHGGRLCGAFWRLQANAAAHWGHRRHLPRHGSRVEPRMVSRWRPCGRTPSQGTRLLH